MTTTTTTNSSNENVPQKRAFHISVPPRMMNVAMLGLVVGTAVGMMRGGRAASLRFLAENAHRAPTTVQGWYFYKKTKNYRVMLGAVKDAGRYAAGFATFGVTLVGAEMGLEQVGLGGVKHLGAAVGTTAVCCGLCTCVLDVSSGETDGEVRTVRLPMAQTQRAVGMAGIMGGVMSGVEWVQGRGRRNAESL